MHVLLLTAAGHLQQSAVPEPVVKFSALLAWLCQGLSSLNHMHSAVRNAGAKALGHYAAAEGERSHGQVAAADAPAR